jgi:hypothetical protein
LSSDVVVRLQAEPTVRLKPDTTYYDGPYYDGPYYDGPYYDGPYYDGPAKTGHYFRDGN